MPGLLQGCEWRDGWRMSDSVERGLQGREAPVRSPRPTFYPGFYLGCTALLLALLQPPAQAGSRGQRGQCVATPGLGLGSGIAHAGL